MIFKQTLFLFLWVNCIFSINMFSQNIEKLKKLKAEPYMVLKIKQFDQFVERFNYEKDFFDRPVDSNFVKEFPREEYLKFLFNHAKNKDTSLFNEQLIQDFIDSICHTEYPIVLNRYSGDIIAELDCKVKLENTNKNINLYLCQEQGVDKSIKWVILKANGLINENVNKLNNRFIPPTSHEINFMNLSALLNNNKDAYSLTYKDYKIDELSIFIDLVNNDKILFEHVTNITFHILSVPGFIFKVRKFDRDELNSGWLISEIERKDISLFEYLKKY